MVHENLMRLGVLSAVAIHDDVATEWGSGIITG